MGQGPKLFATLISMKVFNYNKKLLTGNNNEFDFA